VRPTRAKLARPAVDVAPELLGGLLVSDIGGEPVTVRITEVEAYEGRQDPASHAYRGPTKRTAVMFGPAGYLYCYFVYGMHWCANVTCGAGDIAAAVLLRAGEIVDGRLIAEHRSSPGTPAVKLASGPARLARCLGLDGTYTGVDLLADTSPVRLVSLARPAGFERGPRVGITVAVDHPWRFWLPGEPSVSSFRAGGRTRRASNRQTGPL